MRDAASISPFPEEPRSGEGSVLGSYPTIGTLVNGKYLVEKIVGEGGVGIVVAAQNIELGDRVALKFLRAEMLARTEIVTRFMYEAKAACSIKSDHSATVFDVGRTPHGVPFLVMELLEGRDLASVIEEDRLDVREVAEYGMQACEALAVAHANGVVHRDIKPANLFLETRAGMRSIKVLDFGISKTALTGSVLSTVLPLVKTQHLMGTPLYMSPEQVRSPERVDSRTDIWSLGVVMFEALTGMLPVPFSESITELCAAILESPLASLTQYRNDLPEGFVEVIEKCLEKDVTKRYQNVAELALALLPYAPKRARICAERAGQVLVVAGLATKESVRFPSSMPPALSSGPLPASRLSGPFPRQASGAFALAPPPPTSSRVRSRSGSLGIPSPSPVTLDENVAAFRPGGRKKKVIALLAAVVGLAGAFYAFQLRGQAQEKAVSAAEASTSVSAPTPAPAEPEPSGDGNAATALARAPVKTASAVPTSAYAPPRAPRISPPVVATAPARAPTPNTTAAPAPTPTPKKSDPIDIGY